MQRLLPYAEATLVRHAAPMNKWVVQSVLSGARWESTKEIAEHIARRAAESGDVLVTKKRATALGVAATQPAKKAKKSKRSSNAAVTMIHENATRLVTFDVLDCTLGGGVHSAAVLEQGAPYTRIVGLDCDYSVISTTGKELLDMYGERRFRCFGNRMSESVSMFGEECFDAVMIDLGPTETQLNDPRRGFDLLDENNHPMDMRYGPQLRLGALDYLNQCSQSELAQALRSYELLSSEQSVKLARQIEKRRPFYGSHDVMNAVCSPGEEFTEDGWHCQSSLRKMSQPNKFFLSLRGIVNHERYELKEAIMNAFLLLRDGGRLSVVTSLDWESKMVNSLLHTHPHALHLYTEHIDPSEVLDGGHSRHSKLWVASKTVKSSFAIKNTTITQEEIDRSAQVWVLGATGGQRSGFPASNFTFKALEPRERKTRKRMEKGPKFDYDTDHWTNPRKIIK